MPPPPATTTDSSSSSGGTATTEAEAPPPPPPAPLPPHSADEFRFASKALEGLARGSALFPPRAAGDGWFRPEGAADAEEEERDGELATADDFDRTIFNFEDEADKAAGEAVGEAPGKDGDEPAGKEVRCASVPSVHEREVEAGRLLGAGGFCEVRRATLPGRGGGDRRPYAMKYLSPSRTAPRDDPGGKRGEKPPRNKQFERGVADLAIEARFLARLSHDNIVRLHYVGEGDLAAQFNCGEEGGEGDGVGDATSGGGYRHRFGYFLLLDPLHETLTARIEGTYLPEVFSVGRKPSAPPSSSALKPSRGSWWKRALKGGNAARHRGLPLPAWRAQLAGRLEDLRGVASALRYLHDDVRVIYRDVKPDNVGFRRDPSRGGADVATLFDFGLAKELKPGNLRSYPYGDPLGGGCDTYKLTARSGSRRYMAPEVAFGEPYNEKADVYSFGIVLYSVASLLTPFVGYSAPRHEEEVLGRGRRPSVRCPSGRRATARARRDLGETHEEWLARADEERPEDRRDRLARKTLSAWTKGLRSLVEDCWRSDFRRRPGMAEVGRRLEACARELRGPTTGTAGRENGASEPALAKSCQTVLQEGESCQSLDWQGVESCQTLNWQGQSMPIIPQ